MNSHSDSFVAHVFQTLKQKESFMDIVLHFCIMLHSMHSTKWSDIPHAANKAGKSKHFFFCICIEEYSFNCSGKGLKLSRNSKFSRVNLILSKLKRSFTPSQLNLTDTIHVTHPRLQDLENPHSMYFKVQQ